MGRPTIAFGMHTLHNELLHVRAIPGETRLVKHLRDTMSGMFLNEQSQYDDYVDVCGHGYWSPHRLVRSVAVARKVIAVR